MKFKIIIPIVMVLILIVGLAKWHNNRIRQKAVLTKLEEVAKKQEPEKYMPGINGAGIPERLATKRPIAVMIENHPASRPQSGLSEADIVYETLAEGGITRFMALFQSKDPIEIGPVRSTRPYFNLLADQWAPVLAHSGGSPTALQQLRIGFYRNIADADEALNGKYFTRAMDRFAPHNLFTTGEKLRELVSDREETEWTSPSLLNFFATPTSELKLTTTEITIPFSTASYMVKWKYAPNTNSYSRLQNNTQAIDKNSKQPISTNNVLIQFTESALIPGDATGALQFKLDRSGKIYLFKSGVIVQGTWKHEQNKIVYKDTEGNPLLFQPGPIWIEIVPTSLLNAVTWK